LVNHAGSIRKNQVAAAEEQLLEVNADLIGVILNRVSAKTSGYFYYNYYNISYYQNDKIGDDESRSKRKRKKRKPGFLA